MKILEHTHWLGTLALAALFTLSVPGIANACGDMGTLAPAPAPAPRPVRALAVNPQYRALHRAHVAAVRVAMFDGNGRCVAFLRTHPNASGCY